MKNKQKQSKPQAAICIKYLEELRVIAIKDCSDKNLLDDCAVILKPSLTTSTQFKKPIDVFYLLDGIYQVYVYDNALQSWSLFGLEDNLGFTKSTEIYKPIM